MPAKATVLLFEDKDDPHVVSALFNAHGFPIRLQAKPTDREAILQLPGVEGDPVQIHVKIASGVNDLLERVPVECKASNVAGVGVVLDADVDPSARWHELKEKFERAGSTPLPSAIPKRGFVGQIPDGPRIGAWLMPDNGSRGMLEDFVLSLIPSQDQLLPLVRSFVDSIPPEIRPFSPAHGSKVVVHTWLALQADPGKPLGLAITNRFFDPMQPQCEAFVSWLHRVVGTKSIGG